MTPTAHDISALSATRPQSTWGLGESCSNKWSTSHFVPLAPHMARKQLGSSVGSQALFSTIDAAIAAVELGLDSLNNQNEPAELYRVVLTQSPLPKPAPNYVRGGLMVSIGRHKKAGHPGRSWQSWDSLA